MGMLRIGGRVLQIAGDVMTADAFDEWATAYGKAMIEDLAKRKFLTFLGGQARAKREVKADLAGRVNSPTFKAALDRELSWLPAFVFEEVTKRCERVELLQGRALLADTVVAVPRAPIRDAFAEHLVPELKDSAELQSFAAFPEILLRDVAYKAEATYADLKMPFLLKDGGLGPALVGIDRDYPWPVPNGSVRGHYYIVLRCTAKKEKDIDRDRVASSLGAVQAQLGRASSEDKQAGFAAATR